MEIDHPISISADALSAGFAVLVNSVDSSTTVENIAAPITRCNAENAIAGQHGFCRSLCQAALPAGTRGVALDVVAVHTAQEIVNRHVESLAFEVPQCQI